MQDNIKNPQTNSDNQKIQKSQYNILSEEGFRAGVISEGLSPTFDMLAPNNCFNRTNSDAIR